MADKDDVLIRSLVKSIDDDEDSNEATEQTSSHDDKLSSQQAQDYYENNYNDHVNQRVCECGSTQFDEDQRSGDWICTQCGVVCPERLVSEEAEYRIFSDDSESRNKVRVGAAYNPMMEYSLTEKSRLERDEKEFLWDGLRNIDEIFFKLYKGDSTNTAAQYRAKELFQKVFRIQVDQKKGKIAMKRTGDKKNKNRQKFSRRKQFVVSCIYQALKENNIDIWNTQDLSNQLEGIQVSKYSVKNCLKDLRLPVNY